MSRTSAFITLLRHCGPGSSSSTIWSTSQFNANLFAAHSSSVQVTASVFGVAWILKQNERKARRIASNPYIAKRAESLKLSFEFASGAVAAQTSDVNSRHLAPKHRYFSQNLNKKIKICNRHETERKADAAWHPRELCDAHKKTRMNVALSSQVKDGGQSCV